MATKRLPLRVWLAAVMAVLVCIYLAINGYIVMTECGMNGRGYWVPWSDEFICGSIDTDRLGDTGSTK